MHHSPDRPMLAVQLLRPQEAADLLRVSVRTVQKWIEHDAIPYVQLPSSGTKPSYRIPLQGLLDSLSGTWDLGAGLDLAGGLEAVLQASRGQSLSEAEAGAALDEAQHEPAD